MDKREFMVDCCAGTLASITLVNGAWAADAIVPAARGADHWRNQLGRHFEAPAFGRLRLHEVRPAPPSQGLNQFTLVFVDDTGARTRPAGALVLRRAGANPVALYLEPMSADRTTGCARYAAHFSLLA